MLWRFLLAAVAVSCTLSRTLAHGPRDRIKDLMCVLLLSGMQKEDLDVSMLNKLQRYNVNIHDTNNEDLLQECMTLRNKNNKDTINTTVNIKNEDEARISQENEMSHPQSKQSQTDKQPYIQTVKTKQEISNDTIQYMNGKPKLDSVIKFWQDMNLKNETSVSPKHNDNMNEKYVTEQKNKRNVQENSDSNEADDIKKLLDNYFSKKQHKNSKHSKIEKTTRSIDDIYKELIHRTEKKNYNFETIRNLPNILPLEEGEIDKNGVRLLPIEQPKPYYGNYSNNLSAFNGFNANQDIRYSKDDKRSDSPYIRKYMDFERMVSTTERETQRTISNDMIKEIANSVKEIVLRDLKLNIQATSTLRTSISPSTTTSVTKETLPSNLQMEDNNLKIQQSVLNKFLEMFEEFKSLKKNTILISSSNINKQKTQQVLPRALTLETLNGMEPLKSYNKPYQIQYPKPNSQNINFAQENKFRSNEVQVNVKTAQKFIPIMFQTNNLEIPPLGIPIDKPLNPINQNIIVTTETPYRIGVIKNNLRPRNNPFSDLNKFDERIPKQSHTSKSRDINIPTNYDVRFTSNKGTPKHHQNYYDMIHPSNYRPRSENLEYMKLPELPRFHERLENIDFLDVPDKKRYSDRVDCCNEKYAFSKQMVECCNRKIASRQQLSLNNMKKGSYDDTHFKNFLKTQQKVTDMLEKILATRDTVRSVETT